MRYTAKMIMDRAMNLADISNTDFLTYEEQIQYLQERCNWLAYYESVSF